MILFVVSVYALCRLVLFGRKRRPTADDARAALLHARGVAQVRQTNDAIRAAIPRGFGDPDAQTQANTRPVGTLQLVGKISSGIIAAEVLERSGEHVGATMAWSPTAEVMRAGQSAELSTVDEEAVWYHKQFNHIMRRFEHELNDAITRGVSSLLAPREGAKHDLALFRAMTVTGEYAIVPTLAPALASA
jgi:hypothetical protein